MIEEIFPGHEYYPLLETNLDILKSIEIYGYWKLEWLTAEFREKYLRKKKSTITNANNAYLESKRKNSYMSQEIKKIRRIFGPGTRTKNMERIYIIEIPLFVVEELQLKETEPMLIECQDDNIIIKRVSSMQQENLTC